MTPSLNECVLFLREAVADGATVSQAAWRLVSRMMPEVTLEASMAHVGKAIAQDDILHAAWLAEKDPPDYR